MSENPDLVNGLFILAVYRVGGIPFGFLVGKMRGVDVRIVVAKGSADGIREDVRRFVTCVPASLDAGMREKIESVDHFSVADARAIRIENDRAARKAVFCANNPAVADLLAKTHKAIARTIEAA